MSERRYMRADLNDFYKSALSMGIIHKYYDNFLNTLRKDLSYIHPNEIFTGLNLMTNTQYISIAKQLNIDLFDWDINRDNLNTVKVENLRVDGSIELKEILKIMEKLVVKNNIVLLGKKKDNGTFYWGVKEPLHRSPDNDKDEEDYVDLEDIKKSEIGLVTRELGGTMLSTVLLPTNVYKERVKDFCDLNNLPMWGKSSWKPEPKHWAYAMIIYGLVRKASDIYFWGTKIGLEIGFSILSDYKHWGKIPMTDAEMLNFKTEIYTMANTDINTSTELKVRDYDIDNLGKNEKYRGRLNLLPRPHCDAVNIRTITKEMAEIPFKDLKIRDSIKEEIKKQLMNNYGIWVISGPTGSGKTTTMNSCMGYMRDSRPTDRIESVDRPIEQELEGICQIGLTENSNITEADIGKALTRRNAQILKIGEMNTCDMTRFTVNSALMQLFVIVTMHSFNVPSIPDRVKGFTIGDPAAFEQFLGCVKGMVHQTMMKEICPHCKKKVNLQESELITSEMIDVLTYYGYKEKDILISVPKKDCEVCGGLGFLIDKPIICVETLTVTNVVKRILIKTPLADLQQVIKKMLIENGKTGVNDALNYMREGRVDFLEIWKRFSLFNEVGEWLQEDAKSNIK